MINLFNCRSCGTVIAHTSTPKKSKECPACRYDGEFEGTSAFSYLGEIAP